MDDYINIGADSEGLEHIVPAHEEDGHEPSDDCECSPILAVGGACHDWYLHAPLAPYRVAADGTHEPLAGD